MTKIHIFPRIGANQRLTDPSVYLLLFAALVTCSGCAIKSTVKVPVPQNIARDQTAVFEELLRIARRNDGIDSLRSRLRVTLIRGNIETGIFQQYRSAPGWIVLKRPDSLLLNIQHPLTKTSIFELLSQEDEFKAWDSRVNRLYTGRNSAKNLVPANSQDSVEFTFPGRPQHIFDAILPESVNVETPGVWVSLEEQGDAEARYYILVFSREGTAHRLHIFRKTWIERTGLTVARQQAYTEDGKIISNIRYSYENQTDGVHFPLAIDLDRPLDGYSLKLEFEDLRIDPDIDRDLFFIKRPGAEEVPLVEKRDNDS